MNRGDDGNDIFPGNKNKSQFLDYLEGAANQMKIRLFAYCIMDNYYHLVLENSNGMMSDFLKLLNGQLGSDSFLKLALKKHNRRQIPTDQSIGVQRKDDRFEFFFPSKSLSKDKKRQRKGE